MLEAKKNLQKNQFQIIDILTFSLWNTLLYFILINDLMYDVYEGFKEDIMSLVARPFKRLHSNSFAYHNEHELIQ